MLRKFTFPEKLLFYYVMIDIEYIEQKGIFYHTILVLEARYYLQNNIKRIIINQNGFRCW